LIAGTACSRIPLKIRFGVLFPPADRISDKQSLIIFGGAFHDRRAKNSRSQDAVFGVMEPIGSTEVRALSAEVKRTRNGIAHHHQTCCSSGLVVKFLLRLDAVFAGYSLCGGLSNE
jgi:hypothetical protein